MYLGDLEAGLAMYCRTNSKNSLATFYFQVPLHRTGISTIVGKLHGHSSLDVGTVLVGDDHFNSVSSPIAFPLADEVRKAVILSRCS